MLSEKIIQLAEQVGERLKEKGLKVTAIESCTGGGISYALTSVAGSSDWFEYGLVTYANTAKQELVGVTAEALNQYGAVSEQVVEQMLQGGLEKTGADVAVAVSGIAGPTGGTADKPVGTVWIGVCIKKYCSKVQCFVYNGNRAAVREQSIAQALKMLIEILE